MASRGDKPMASYYRPDNTIYFDLDRVNSSWADKPWQKPRDPNVKPLEDSYFPTPEAWSEFVLRHELAHSRVERFKANRGQTEDLARADYENWMNRIALSEMRSALGIEKTDKFATTKQKLAVARINTLIEIDEIESPPVKSDDVGPKVEDTPEKIEGQDLRNKLDDETNGPKEEIEAPEEVVEAPEEVIEDDIETQKSQVSEEAKQYSDDLDSELENADEAIGQILDDSSDELKAHYQTDDLEVVRQNIVSEVATALRDGLGAVASAVREVVRKIISAMSMTAVIVNPMPTGKMPDKVMDSLVSVNAIVPVSEIPDSALAVMSRDAVLVYQNVIARAKEANVRSIIVDKAAGRIHLFDEAGNHTGTSNAVYGKSTGEEWLEEFRLTNYAGADGKTKWNTVPDKARVTPAGLSIGKVTKYSNYPSPILAISDNGKIRSTAIHWNKRPGRQTAIDSADIGDNAATFGCVSIDKGFWDTHFDGNMDAFEDSLIFVMPREASDLGKYLEPNVKDAVIKGAATGEPDVPPEKGVLPRRRKSSSAPMRVRKANEPAASMPDEPKAPGYGRAFLSSKQRKYLDSLEARIERMEERQAGPEKLYLPRYWRADRIAEDEAGPQQLRKTLTDWYESTAGEKGYSPDPEDIARRVDETINTLLGDAEWGEMQFMQPRQASAGASFLKSRELDIPNELVFDFIETDMEKVVRAYSDRFGTLNEMQRMFGSVDMEDAIDNTLMQTAKEMNIKSVDDALDQLEGLRKQFEYGRDSLTGAVYDMSPAKMNQRRLSAAARAYGVTTYLGRATLSSIPEAGRMLMVHGFRRTFGAITQHMLGDFGEFRKLSQKLAMITGEGVDTILSTGSHRFAVEGGPTGSGSGSMGRAVNKGVDFANGPYFIANLLSPYTDITKRMSQTFTHQFFLEDLHKIAGGKGGKKLRERMASYGLSKEDADKIVSMPLEKTNGGLYLPNMDEWPDRDLARRYASAVGGMTRRIIPTAGKADIPEIAKGFVRGREYPLLVLPFQFMAYGFAAANKVLLSAAQGRDQSAMAGAGALIGLGWLTVGLKTDDQWWDNMSMADKSFRAVDASGIFGIYSDIPTMIETATQGQVGIRPMLGMKPFAGETDTFDAAGEVGGPVASAVADYTRLFLGEDDTTAGEVGGVIRRSIPLNNLFYWRSIWRDGEGAITDAIDQ
jgi:hypothetical protein